MGRRGLFLGLVVAVVAGGCREQGSRSAPATFAAKPSALAFGAIALGDESSAELVLTNQGTSPFTVYKVESTVPGISVDVSAPFELVGGAGKTLTVRLAPGVEGQLDGALAITTDSDTAGERGVAHIPFSGLGVKAVLEVRPPSIDFGNVELDSVKLQELVVVNPSSAKTKFRFDLEGEDADLFSSSDEGRVLEIGPGETRPLPLAFKSGRMGVALATAKVSVCPVCEPVPVALTGSGVTSALEVTPLRVDFGRVPVGASAEQLVYVRNLGTEPLPFSGIELLSNDAGLFSISRAPSTTSLAAGASLQLGVSFSPKVNGPAPSALLHVKVQAPNTSSTGPKLALVGEGGRGCIVVLPSSGLDFGEVPENVGYTRAVTVLNRCQAPVWLSDFALKTTSGGFFSLGTASPTVSIAANGSAEVPVVFTPRTGSGTSQGSLTFRSTDGGSANSTELVALTGSTRKFAPCSYRLAPDTLDFGRVAVGAEVVLGVTLENTGTDVCFVSGFGLASGSDAAFTSTPPSSPRIAPGAKGTLLVHFRPTDAGTFGALAEAFVNSPTLGHPTAPIAGEGVQSCFTVQPATIDFGRMKLGCDPRTRPVVAKNACTGPVDLATPALDAGGSAAFSLSGAGAVSLAAGTQATFSATYAPAGEGVDTSAIRIDSSDGAYTVGLVGSAQELPAQTDRFFQEGHQKVDLLFVIDNSGSMMEEQQNLARNFAALLSAAEAAQADYHIGVTTTGLTASPGGWTACPGGAEGGENGRLFPVNGSTPRIITPQTPNAEQVFAANVQVGWCHWNEQGLDGAFRALSEPLLSSADDPRTPILADGNAGFVRPDAKLAIVFVTDEEDFSSQPVSFYETYFRALKNDDPSLLTISAIVGPENLSTCPTAASVGTRYLALARATGGVTESICTPNWAASLKNLSDNTFGARRSFALSQLPADPAQITVTVDGEPVTSGWSYQAAPNAVIFEIGKAPAAGALVEVSYPLGC